MQIKFNSQVEPPEWYDRKLWNCPCVACTLSGDAENNPMHDALAADVIKTLRLYVDVVSWECDIRKFSPIWTISHEFVSQVIKIFCECKGQTDWMMGRFASLTPVEFSNAKTFLIWMIKFRIIQRIAECLECEAYEFTDLGRTWMCVNRIEYHES